MLNFSILGAAAVIIGLYTVLLGKAREMKEKLLESEDFVSNPSKAAQEKASFKIDDLEQPLLADICNDQV